MNVLLAILIVLWIVLTLLFIYELHILSEEIYKVERLLKRILRKEN